MCMRCMWTDEISSLHSFWLFLPPMMRLKRLFLRIEAKKVLKLRSQEQSEEWDEYKKMCGKSHFSHHINVVGNLFQCPLLNDEEYPKVKWPNDTIGILHLSILGLSTQHEKSSSRRSQQIHVCGQPSTFSSNCAADGMYWVGDEVESRSSVQYIPGMATWVARPQQ